MSEKLDSLFDQLRGLTPPAAFAPADQVRRRGRQRSRRKALAAGCAVFAVTAVAAGVATGLVPLQTGHDAGPAEPSSQGATATGAPTTAPTTTGIPAALMLQIADLGPGAWEKFTGEVFEGADPWYWAESCAAYETSRFPSLPHQLSVETVSYRIGQQKTLVEIVERYAGGWGPANLDDVRAVIALCGTATPPPGEAPTRHTIVDTGFAGDESVLVKTESWGFQGETIAPEPMLVQYVAVVRVGDLVATVWSWPEDAANVRTLAERAAARLR